MNGSGNVAFGRYSRLLRASTQRGNPWRPPQTLQELYTEEVRDLWSANDQMQRIVATMADKAADAKLRDLLQRSVTGIGEHTASLRSLVSSETGSQCKGMEGLVAEAQKHAVDADLSPELRDLEIIAQYQRMSHYGIAGFGTAAAYARATKQSDKAQQLETIVSDIYKADEYASLLAENVERAAA